MLSYQKRKQKQLDFTFKSSKSHSKVSMPISEDGCQYCGHVSSTFWCKLSPSLWLSCVGNGDGIYYLKSLLFLCKKNYRKF